MFNYSGEGKVVGNYTITATIVNNNNYIISGENSLDFSIVQKDVSLTWTNTTLTYNGKAQKPNATVIGVCAGDTCNVIVTGEQIEAGSYTATAEISNDNYNLSANTKNFNIGKKGLTITVNPHTITYGDAPSNNGVSYSGFVNGEDESVLTGSLNYGYVYVQYANVGTYNMTASGVTAKNYNVTYKSGTLTVKARPITVTIDNKTSIYGKAVETLTASITQGTAVGGDDNLYKLPEVVTTNSTVGEYVIKGNTTNTNYDITFINGVYSITKATLTVTANSVCEVVYGSNPNIESCVEVTTNNGKSVTVTYNHGVTSTTNVGEYGYTVNYDTVNYELIKVNPENFKIVVKAKAVTISWQVNAEYGLDNYAQLKPNVEGATLNNLQLSYTYQAVSGLGGQVVNNVPVAGGTYIVTISSTNANYELSGLLSTQFVIVVPVQE